MDEESGESAEKEDVAGVGTGDLERRSGMRLMERSR